MILETPKEQICMHQMIGEKKDIFNVESDVIVNDIKPDVLRAINTNGTICINKKEIMDGKIKIEGEINTYIIYLADDEEESTRSLNACLNFAEFFEIPEMDNNTKAEVNLKIKNIETKIINGRKINVKVFIEAQTKLYMNGEIAVIGDIDEIENMEVLKTNEQVISLLGEGDTRVNAKDTISIDDSDEIAEIMKVDFKISNQEVKTSYNKVLVKAEAEVAIMYMTENNKISLVNAKIPVMGFIDMPNVDDDCICNANNTLRSLVIKPNSNEEHSIYVEADIEFHIETYQTKQIDIIEDLYSVKDDVSFKSRKVETITGKQNIKEEYNIKENLEIPELKNGNIYSATTMPNIIKENLGTNKILYEGEIKIEMLYSSGNTIDSKILVIPFNFEISSKSIEPTSRVTTDININNENIIILPNGSININMSLEFNLSIEKNRELNLIEEITVNDCKNTNPYSMVIYFVKPEDTLWNIAKKFKSKVEDITRLNNLETDNKIVAGNQLYIPKLIKYNG